ncbi:MAG: 16S rRNA (guanine(527)-N(7))-methyltransferase RsmG [Clostridia bacterium]|nr:16S rRNA (guanine(527)-N(7))-methyltransferase RsmG [Clostridia bacterium]
MTKQEYLELSKKLFKKNDLEDIYSEELIFKLQKLSDIFLETNSHMNLTAIKDEKLVISRHFIDCLMCIKEIPSGAKVLDVGSGGGMPSLPIAIARPDVTVVALDATAKKINYIINTANLLGLSNLTGISGRAEELANTKMRESFDVVTARAVAELRILAEWCAPYIKTNGLFIALKGKNALEEVSNAQNALKTLSLCTLKEDKSNLVDFDGTISDRYTLVYKKSAATKKQYPRKNAQIMKNPL